MDRREFLALTSAAGSGILAGCSEGDSSSGGTQTTAESTNTTTQTTKSGSVEHDEEGPPYYEEVQIELPDRAQVMEEITYTVTVANTGGRTGDFSTTLRVGEDPFETASTIEIKNIEPGEVKTKEFGPIYGSRARDVTFRITDYGVTDSITIEPYEAKAGEAVTLRDVYLKPRKPTFRQNAIVTQRQYSDETEETAFASDENEVMVVLPFSIENKADENKSIRTGSFGIEPGVNASQEWPDIVRIRNISQQRLETGTYEPGDYSTGWVLFEIPDSALESGFQLQYPKDSPDVIWKYEPPSEGYSVPRYELVKSEVPENVTAYQNLTLEYKIQNTGPVSGTFEGAFSIESSVYKRIIRELEPNESITINGSYRIPPKDNSELKPLNVSLFGHESMDHRTLVSPEVPTYDVGSTFFPHNDLGVKVNSMEFGTEFKLPDAWGDGYNEVDLSEGMKWLFLEIVSDSSADDVPVAQASEFSLDSNLAGFEVGVSYPGSFDDHGNPFRGSVNGKMYNPTDSDTGPNMTASGWLIFEVPSDVATSDLTVLWKAAYNSFSESVDRDAPYIARWRTQ